MRRNQKVTRWRTQIVGVRLRGCDYQRAHEAAHANAAIWNNAVAWVRETWAEGHEPSVFDIKKYILTLHPHERPVHTHTAQEVAFDLADAISTYRANRAQHRRARAPWRHKSYRPLSFTRNYGWRITPTGRLALSLGHRRAPITITPPVVTDPTTGRRVDPALWGEIRLCWDTDDRAWTLHIATPAALPPPLNPARVTAIDEGVINPMTLATRQDDGSIDITVINGREARAIKRGRAKTIGKLDRQMSRCADGSRQRRRLANAKKKAKSRARRQLRDFNHQVSRAAARHIQTHDTGTIYVGDVRGIEQRTRQRQRRTTNRSQRQQLSQWERGTHEDHLAYKTGVTLTHINESYSSQTCPACLTRNRPTGRNYQCRTCGFTCHRDAAGAINILMRAHHGNYTRIDPDTPIGVTYLRAVPRWSPHQREQHSARSRATNQATATSRVTGHSNGSHATNSHHGTNDHKVTAP